MPQPFHVQGVSFLVKSVNGAAPLVEDAGFKDTVWVDGDVELLVYFNQPSYEHFPFLYYSGALEMADRGTTGQMIITPSMSRRLALDRHKKTRQGGFLHLLTASKRIRIRS